MSPEKSTHVSEAKINTVRELSELVKNKKTILIASIKSIPASQFQEIGKKLRGKAIIKVPKKNLIFRVLDSSENNVIKKLKEQIKDSAAVLFSDLDCFELASELINNKSPAKAKVGQEAPEDIEVQAGPTDLVPGPAISELGALAGLENATSCPRSESSLAIGNDLVSNPRSLVGRVVKRNLDIILNTSNYLISYEA